MLNNLCLSDNFHISSNKQPLLISALPQKKHPPPKSYCQTSAPHPHFPNSRDTRKTCFSNHFIYNFLSLNYSGIRTGEFQFFLSPCACIVPLCGLSVLLICPIAMQEKIHPPLIIAPYFH